MILIEDSRNYHIEITADQFLKLVEITDDLSPNIFERLEKQGADQIDFNGHFGPNIWFRSEKTALPSILKEIKLLLKELNAP